MSKSSAPVTASSTGGMPSEENQPEPTKSSAWTFANLPAEAIDLKRLVEHSHAIAHDLSLERVQRRFRETGLDFFALLEDRRVIGICSRSRTDFILGSRFGFSLFAGYPATMAAVGQSLILREDTPVRHVLEAAFNRPPEAFYEDVALVGSETELLGLISTRKLVQLQSRLVADQMSELHRQHEATQRQNNELFHANHALRQSQALYRALFESHALGVALLGVDGRLHNSNRQLAELLSFSPEAPAATTIIDRLRAKDLSVFVNTLASHEHDPAQPPQTREYTLDLPARGPRRFKITTGWIAETGQISACFDDVTEQRSLERLMIRQEKQLLLDTMVGGVAHELNNKLTPVLGYAELLRLEKDRRVQNCAQNIGRSIEEAAHIIRQLLQLAKPESGNFGTVDFKQVLFESITMLKFKLQDSGCHVRTHIPDAPALVYGDHAQLKQVVINLVLNSLQAMEGRGPGSLQLRIELKDAHLLFSVADTGAGIPPELMSRIFDPFFTTKGPDRGTGLGLSICSSIVREHGGDISVESEPGKGTKFTLVLPLESSNRPESATAARRSTSQSPFRDGYVHAQVLVVDDEGVLRSLLQEMLRSCFRCTVDQAQNGQEALAAIERKHYDLIVADIRMPVMDGVELFIKLQSTHPAAAKRFVFVTGYAGDKTIEQRIANWGVPVIAKPFKLSRLSEVCFPFLVNPTTPRQLDFAQPAPADTDRNTEFSRPA